MAIPPRAECLRQSDCDRGMEIKATLFTTACEILETAAKSESCVPYEQENYLHKMFRLGMYCEPDGPFNKDIDTRGILGDFASLHLYGLGVQAVYGDNF